MKHFHSLLLLCFLVSCILIGMISLQLIEKFTFLLGFVVGMLLLRISINIFKNIMRDYNDRK